MKSNKCYVPLDIQLHSDFFSGFGKKEFSRAIIGIIAGLIISLIINMFINQTIVLIVMIAVFISISFSLNVRDRITNFSFIDEIINIIRVMKMQKYYPYKYLEEFDLNSKS